MRCPNCGAPLIYNDTNNTHFCKCCKVAELATEKVVEKAVCKDASSESNYNLVISNQATHRFSQVRFTSKDANIHGSIKKDEIFAYQLVPGPHKITFYYGKYSDTFGIVILTSGDPVKITFIGSPDTSFVIDQPNAGEAYKDLVNGKYPSEVTPLSIVALVLSLTVLLSFCGFILGVIDLNLAKSHGKNGSKTSSSAIIFGCIFMIIGVLMVISVA